MISKSEIPNLKVGDKVCYQPEHYSEDEWENGFIKEVPDFALETESVRVVYHWGNDIDNWKNYTAALTNLRDLHKGWKS